MLPAPMRRSQTSLVILAAFLVAGALFPWPARYRLACAAGVAAITLMLFVSRLRAHAGTPAAPVDEAQARIDRIRAARDERMRRRR
jgi:hypothetical protein